MATKLLTLLIGIIGTYSLYSQGSQNINFISDKKYYKSQGAVYVPMGSYKDTSGKIISVQAFFMTNEITNKEYREFTDCVASHPDSSIYYIDLKKTAMHLKDSVKKDRSYFIQKVPFSQLKNILIDSLALAKEYPYGSELYNKYKNYFIDKKYDDYPVVGVSRKVAKYYGIWKTLKENKVLKKEGTGIINDFRPPTKEEFDYAKSFSPNFPNEEQVEVRKSKSGKADKLGSFNLFDNVDEWINSWDNTVSIPVKSGTWKISQGVKNNKKESFDADGSSGQIGFRLVSTFLGK